MSVMSSGKLTQQQVDIAQRIAVKVLAVLGIQESNKKQEKRISRGNVRHFGAFYCGPVQMYWPIFY